MFSRRQTLKPYQLDLIAFADILHKAAAANYLSRNRSHLKLRTFLPKQENYLLCMQGGKSHVDS